MKTEELLKRVIVLPIARLIEDPANANKMGDHEFASLVTNIQQAGMCLQPILVKAIEGSDDFQIVDGHHRTRATGHAGLTKILAVIWDGTEDMRRALSIGMNKIRGALDLGAVADQIRELAEAHDWTPADLTMTGYSEDEINDLLKSAQPSDADEVLAGAAAGIDRAEPPETTQTFVLELSFGSAQDLQLAKRALKRAAGGKGCDMSDGLLAMISAQA